MQTLIFRHAERVHVHSDDPPLSQKGSRQSQQLAELVANDKLPWPSRIFSSPKARAIQTFQPLAEFTKLPLQIFTDLNERQSSENSEIFGKRVKRFLEYVEGQSGVLYIVSHLDWIEEALIYIPSDINLNTPKYQTWAPGQSLEFEVSDGIWSHAKLRNLP